MAQLTAFASPGAAVLETVARRIEEISTLPHVALRVMQIANNPDSSATDLKGAMESDAALSPIGRSLRARQSRSGQPCRSRLSRAAVVRSQGEFAPRQPEKDPVLQHFFLVTVHRGLSRFSRRGGRCHGQLAPIAAKMGLSP